MFSGPFAKQKIMYTNSSYHGIIELRHFIDPRRMAQLREWECIMKHRAIAVMLQSCLDETHLVDGEVEFCAMIHHHFLFCEGPVEAPPIEQYFLSGIFLGCAKITGESGEMFWSQSLRNWRNGRVRNPCSKTPRKK